MSTIIIALAVAGLAIFKKEVVLFGQVIFMMLRATIRSPRALFSPLQANWLAFEIWEEKVSAGLTRSFLDVEGDILELYAKTPGKDATRARGRFKHHVNQFLSNPVRFYKDALIAMKNAKELAYHHNAQLVEKATQRQDPRGPGALATLNRISAKAEAEAVGRFAELVEVAMPVLRMLRQVEFLVLSGINFYQARNKSMVSTLDRGVNLSSR